MSIHVPCIRVLLFAYAPQGKSHCRRVLRRICHACILLSENHSKRGNPECKSAAFKFSLIEYPSTTVKREEWKFVSGQKNGRYWLIKSPPNFVYVLWHTQHIRVLSNCNSKKQRQRKFFFFVMVLSCQNSSGNKIFQSHILMINPTANPSLSSHFRIIQVLQSHACLAFVLSAKFFLSTSTFRKFFSKNWDQQLNSFQCVCGWD